MIAAVVLHLQAQANGHIYGGTGRAVHGFWHKQWAATLPAVADRLHHDSGVKPFALSPLMDLPQPVEGGRYLPAGTFAWLRIAVLHSELARQLLETWLTRLPAQIELAGIPWRLHRICLTPQEHPWAGQTSYDQIIAGAPLPPAATRQDWRLHFVTPTAFRAGDGSHFPFPLPDSLVASWLRSWRAFADRPLLADLDPPAADLDPAAFRQRLRDHLLIKSYRLKTVPVRYGRRLAIGCTGPMTLHAKKLSAADRAAVTRLARFAFYTGSGRHTTQGMGLTRFGGARIQEKK